MFKLTSLFLFTAYTFSSVHGAMDWTGAAGQDCTPPDDDSAPEVCTTSGQKVVFSEKVECEENYDCCLCGVIKCKPYCDGFKAGGDYSAYGVPKIVIQGNTDDGAEIDCDGDSSCRKAVITGTYIKGIKCGGDFSCAGSEITAECMEDDPCKLECDGDKSCQWSDMVLTNVETVSCGDRACRNSVIDVTNPDEDFKLECGAEKACKKAQITIYVDGDVQNYIKSIDCGGFKACKKAEITIINTGTKKVIIEELNCESDRACVGATFTVEGNVKVKDCDCKEVNDYESCEGATFVGFEC